MIIISDNKLKQLQSYSKLKTLYYNNQLTELSNYPKLKYLKCDNNRINKFANYRLVTTEIINSQRITQSTKNILNFALDRQSQKAWLWQKL